VLLRLMRALSWPISTGGKRPIMLLWQLDGEWSTRMGKTPNIGLSRTLGVLSGENMGIFVFEEEPMSVVWNPWLLMLICGFEVQTFIGQAKTSQHMTFPFVVVPFSFSSFHYRPLWTYFFSCSYDICTTLTTLLFFYPLRTR